jgi:hypothetical protein
VNISPSKPTLNDHCGGTRRAGSEVAIAEFGEMRKTDEREGLPE